LGDSADVNRPFGDYFLVCAIFVVKLSNPLKIFVLFFTDLNLAITSDFNPNRNISCSKTKQIFFAAFLVPAPLAQPPFQELAGFSVS
jgi:hypothetical protein